MRKDENELIQYHKRAMLLLQFREFFSDLKEEPNDSNDFKNACKFTTRCVELEEKGRLEIERNCPKNYFRVAGTGVPTKAVDVRNGFFEYFIDVRTTMKERLPIKLFLDKAKEIFHSYNEERRERGEEPEVVKFSNRWFKG